MKLQAHRGKHSPLARTAARIARAMLCETYFGISGLGALFS